MNIGVISALLSAFLFGISTPLAKLLSEHEHPHRHPHYPDAHHRHTH